MKLEPTSKQMLAIERHRLAGTDPKLSLRRWQHSMNMMSGAFCILSGKPENVTPAHFVEWYDRLDYIRKDMERLRKKLAPKPKRRR